MGPARNLWSLVFALSLLGACSDSGSGTSNTGSSGETGGAGVERSCCLPYGACTMATETACTDQGGLLPLIDRCEIATCYDLTWPEAWHRTSFSGDVPLFCAAINEGRNTLPVPQMTARNPITGRTGDFSFETTIEENGATELILDEVRAATLTNRFPCGEGDYAYVLCASDDELVPGEYAMLWMKTQSDFPVETESYYQYGFVVDRDGDSDNNYESLMYPDDFFNGTDFWVVLSKAPGEGWSIAVQDATDGVITPIEDAKVRVIADTRGYITALVPASLLGAGPRAYRTTIHKHLGDLGENEPWSGAVVPPVSSPLASFYSLPPGTVPPEVLEACDDLVLHLESLPCNGQGASLSCSSVSDHDTSCDYTKYFTCIRDEFKCDGDMFIVPEGGCPVPTC